MLKESRIAENSEFRTVDIHLATKSYYIKVTEKEIDDEGLKHGINPVQQRLYATPTQFSRNMLAQDIAERKLLEILEDEILGVSSSHDYIIKMASDWDSKQSHNFIRDKNLDNNDKYWGDSREKYTMINGKYIYKGE